MARYGKVTSPGLKLRLSIPTGKVIDELSEGDDVEIIDEDKSATVTWFFVRSCRTNDKGWVAARFIHERVIPKVPDVPSPPPAGEVIDGTPAAWPWWTVPAVIGGIGALIIAIAKLVG